MAIEIRSKVGMKIEKEGNWCSMIEDLIRVDIEKTIYTKSLSRVGSCMIHLINV